MWAVMSNVCNWPYLDSCESRDLETRSLIAVAAHRTSEPQATILDPALEILASFVVDIHDLVPVLVWLVDRDVVARNDEQALGYAL